ncbi:CAZyme family AA7 [Aspergillus niger]|uniref:Cytochrome P450 family protein n=1 Tax=Aspergillus niger TaxID=5061 RepID=A0A3F3RCK0_ASPNG|nr:CAZyme family AA7 [Aspergillus niger]KAI2834348.1 CAZyme family AA7 [Aspergillus niger]KAI2861189.1 CAZyme family AA7 [Aspergillus niger]KAI2868545.1 CAZyme family AA7 [Aspergillus niger]KAI2874800.1 CAZyme family AA7 [Aspergillus niger]
MDVIWRDKTDEADYETARLRGIFTKDIPPYYPLAIVHARTTNDVTNTIELAKQKGCQVAVRAGGHSHPVWSLHPNSILLDLGYWKELDIDNETKIARATPAVTSGEISKYLNKRGLFFTTAHHPDVGLGGYMLQGGSGWNYRRMGWACESLAALEVVTANGKLLLCNRLQNQELYWAARGAGPAFPGVVTNFYLQASPFHADGVRSSGYVYPSHRYREIFTWAQSMVAKTTPDIDILLRAMHSESNDDISLTVQFFAMEKSCSDAEQALRIVDETRPSGAISEWFCEEDSLKSQYAAIKKSSPPGYYYLTDNVLLNNDGDAISVLQEAFLTLPQGKSWAGWTPRFPSSKHTITGMAKGIQANHYFVIHLICEDATGAMEYKKHLQDIMQRIRPHTVGHYLGDSDLNDDPKWYWGEENSSRLMRVRQRWDPDGLFAATHNGPA